MPTYPSREGHNTLMPTPQLLNDLISVLLLMAPLAALLSLLFAGMSLSQQGRVTLGFGGGLTKWILWAIFFVTVQPLLSWLTSFGIVVPALSGGITNSWLASLQADVSQFINTFILQRLTPTLAAFLLLRGVLDTASGQQPSSSIVAAMFLLGTQTTYGLFESYNTGTRFALVDVLDSLWNHISGTIMPLAAVLALIGAIVNFATRRPFVRLLAVSLAMLTLAATWRLLMLMM